MKDHSKSTFSSGLPDMEQGDSCSLRNVNIYTCGLHMVWHVFVLIIVECKMYGVIIKTFIIIIIIVIIII